MTSEIAAAFGVGGKRAVGLSTILPTAV